MHIPDLYYEKREQWYPLPNWGKFFLELGYTVGQFEKPDRRAVIGLALPTKAYAASLIATGIVAGHSFFSNDSKNALKRFNLLKTLDIGTSLYYRRDRTFIKVFFEGIQETNHGIKIKLHGGNAVYYVSPESSLQIDFPTKDFSSLPKKAQGKSDAVVSPFLIGFIGEKAAKMFITISSLECVIIGSLKRIEFETCDTRFAVGNFSGDLVPGSLQDILRIRRSCVNGETYRSDVYYTYNRVMPNFDQEKPTVVVFDGAKSFLTWGTYWRHPHNVVILDQTETDFEAAIQAFNEAFIKNHLDEMLFHIPLSPPKGLYISVYEERQR